MAISLFKKPEPAAIPPAREALNANLAADKGIQKEIEAISARLRILNDDVIRRDNMAADINAQRAAIDSRLADARYSGKPDPTIETDQRALKEREEKFVHVGEVARVADAVRPRLMGDIEALGKKRKALRFDTDFLLWAAVKEEADTHLAAYLATRAAMKDIAHKLFAARLAADTISKSRGYGDFVGSGLYHDLHIPLPPHPSIQELTVEAARNAKVVDARRLQEEAEQLIHGLLNAEG